MPHGPFHRVRVRRDDATLDAFVPGPPPAVGAIEYASVASALVYRDGLLVDRVTR